MGFCLLDWHTFHNLINLLAFSVEMELGFPFF